MVFRAQKKLLAVSVGEDDRVVRPRPDRLHDSAGGLSILIPIGLVVADLMTNVPVIDPIRSRADLEASSSQIRRAFREFVTENLAERVDIDGAVGRNRKIQI